MKRLSKAVVIASLCLSFVAPVFSQEIEQDTLTASETVWDTLNARVESLIQQAQYEDAVSVAKEALKVAEEKFGSDHPGVATSLNNLAELYRTQGQYAEAAPYPQRHTSYPIWYHSGASGYDGTPESRSDSAPKTLS